MAQPLARPRRLLLINGPNLNLLGTREPAIYGSTTLAQITSRLDTLASALNVTVIPIQSNHEGAIIDFLHSHYPANPIYAAGGAQAGTQVQAADGIIINPAAFTHTSVAIRDALLGISVPFVEVHLSNIHTREPWRTHSYFSDKAAGVIMGLGAYGYEAALGYWADRWRREDEKAA